MNKEHEQACSKLRLTHRLNSVELLSTSTSTKLRRKSEKRKKYGNKHLHINRVCFTIMACRLWVNMHSMVSSAESKFVECKYIPLPVPLNKSNIVQITFLCSKAHNKIFRCVFNFKFKTHITQCIKELQQELYTYSKGQYCGNSQ